MEVAAAAGAAAPTVQQPGSAPHQMTLDDFTEVRKVKTRSEPPRKTVTEEEKFFAPLGFLYCFSCLR